MNKIVFVIPNPKWVDKRRWDVFPFSALVISSILKDEFDFTLIDADINDYSVEYVEEKLRTISPEVILTTSLSHEYYSLVRFTSELCKRTCPDAITILGGVYATVLPKNSLNDKNVDLAFTGYAEGRLLPLLKDIVETGVSAAANYEGVGYRDADGSVKMKPFDIDLKNVDRLVPCDYSNIDIEKYLKSFANIKFNYQMSFKGADKAAIITTSRGCPYNCNFCATRAVTGRSIKFYTAEQVIDDIEYFAKNHGVRSFIILDECFLADKPRAYKIMECFKKWKVKWKITTVAAWHLDSDTLERMRESGCVFSGFSPESGSQRILKEVIHKPLKLDLIPPLVEKCKELGIWTGASMIVGFPDETWDEIRQTFAFADEMDFDYSQFHVATPMPNTALYESCKEHNLLPEGFTFESEEFFGMGGALYETDEFSKQDLLILRAYEWDRINFKTPEKTQTVADMFNVSLEELLEHRKQTRKKLGLHFEK